MSPVFLEEENIQLRQAAKSSSGETDSKTIITGEQIMLPRAKKNFLDLKTGLH